MVPALTVAAADEPDLAPFKIEKALSPAASSGPQAAPTFRHWILDP
jgi:hypothetical protein